ncbi:recombinase family protein [Methylobacterium trifolii]|uniref:Recombinase family protein n=1 Tax=Methylobacterium trifolii TaxID=1003092 RepID=A0ABQ4U2X6_9HYPH|nr:recombinase family protein [Methylobacterium trifolii]GJE61101.1 hypothetical protein MPOCJGCO_3222 [Methylobacterium trifolii]
MTLPGKTLRCAIYTRVSTEHGLEQAFNSLHNQREAAEAYVRSQAHEGWRCSGVRYDDGGYSGGSLERPALQRLLAEVRAGRVDVIVVYKVDRLTRALSDFAKLVELFDANAVSFVSVTQAFNTTSSMGRLTLNVLLSFAQFERELTGERIRDKIASSKRRGLWMGGVVPLGYRVEARALHPVPEHAALIGLIYRRYLELGTVGRLKLELDRDGILVPERVDGAGRRTGGKGFSRGQLYAILANPIYAGQLVHKGQVHPGQQPPLVDEATFAAVQARLAANHRELRRPRSGEAHLLIGRIRDGQGHAMTPTHTQKCTRRYRYYVSQAVLKASKAGAAARQTGIGAAAPPDAIGRVSAPDLEARVIAALRDAIPARRQPAADADLVADHLAEVRLHPDRLVLRLLSDEPDTITIAWTRPSTQRRREIVLPPAAQQPRPRPMKVEDRARILKAIAMARAWMEDLVSGRVSGIGALAERAGIGERSVRMSLSLAHLSPTIVAAIMAGRLPRGISLRHLAELPVAWSEQQAALGL